MSARHSGTIEDFNDFACIMSATVSTTDQQFEPMTMHVVTTEGAPFDRALDGESFVIGRSSKADLTVPDRSMSRMHARLFLKDGAWHVEDLGSRNGTLIGGSPVDRPTRVEHGAVIQVGSTTITLREASRPMPPARDSSVSHDSHTIFKSAAELLQEPEAIRTDSATPVGESLRRYADRLRLLTEVNRALDRIMSLEELLDMILDRAFHHLRPEDAAIFLRNDRGGYDSAASRSSSRGDTDIVFSSSLMEEVVEGRQAALVLDAQTDERFHEAVSLLDAGVRSLVAAPLLDPDGALGLIVLASRLTVRQFTEDDMELLASLASVAAMRIRNIRLAEEAAERRRLEQEVALAREIQVSLLPDRLPNVPGWDIAADNFPSRGVSGDFYKVEMRHHGGEVVLMLSDVSGKGIAASLLTASLEALTAGPIHDGVPVEDIFRSTSHLLFERTPPEKYATSFLASIDPATGVLRFCNAGHNPGLLMRADGSTEWLESTGMPLGILPEGSFAAGERTLEVGDTLVLYTDGITEPENPEEEEYGQDRLAAVCVEHREEPVADIMAAVEKHLFEFARGVPFLDDRTMVLIRRLKESKPS
jgi:serine phosphatase RsbU (regulator of sigma subunit)/pSer/pThr/pTyr-binding forkhead associated (FHA) protein